jgi:dethiobiotin synthetase
MMGKTIFITGTDTNVGKTVITGCLASILLKKGKKVAVYKPVQCGNLLNGRITSPDLKLVRDLSAIDEDGLYNDYCFKLAASPHLAAEKECRKVDVGVIKNRVKCLQKKYDYVLIEGAGGLMVPLTRSYTVLDLIKELEVPVVVVARALLGTINHTSMTVKILKENHVELIGVVMNNYKDGIIESDNKRIISSINGVKIVGVVPYSKNLRKLSDSFEKYFNLKFL